MTDTQDFREALARAMSRAFAETAGLRRPPSSWLYHVRGALVKEPWFEAVTADILEQFQIERREP